jgi:hypothetical protein
MNAKHADDVVEVVLSWGEAVIATKYLRAGEAFALGEAEGCDAVLPREAIGAARADVVVCDEAGDASVDPPRGARVWIDGRLGDPAVVKLEDGRVVDVEMAAFRLRARVVADEHVATSWTDAVDTSGAAGWAASAGLHASVFAALLLFMPALGATDSDTIDRDRLLTMQHLLDASAMREEEALEDAPGAAAEPEDHGASGGGRATGAEGAMGAEKAPREAVGHWSAKGDAARELATLSRAEKLALVQDFGGMIGVLASARFDPNAPVVPWGDVLNGSDRESHLGSLFGTDAADVFGFGGLALSGTDEGGGGDTVGIGVNDIGDLGKSLDRRLGSGDFGPGGYGHGCGGKPCIIGRGHDPRGPSLRMPKEISTNGRLPAEVIQRIVRQNMGRFRACYEGGLRTNPTLEGRVAVRFVIDRTGQVSVAQDAGSDLPDENVKQCIVRSFFSLSFPSPDDGMVTVSYPIALTPAQ